MAFLNSRSASMHGYMLYLHIMHSKKGSPYKTLALLARVPVYAVFRFKLATNAWHRAKNKLEASALA